MAVPTVCVGLNVETITGPFFSSAHVWNMMHAELTTPPCNHRHQRENTYHATPRHATSHASCLSISPFRQYHEHEGEDDLEADLGRPGG
jgi:hypothetical protein